MTLLGKLLVALGFKSAFDVLQEERNLAVQVFVEAKDKLEGLTSAIEAEVQNSFAEIEKHNKLLGLLAQEKAKAANTLGHLEKLINGDDLPPPPAAQQ